jgi:hypothetical protein
MIRVEPLTASKLVTDSGGIIANRLTVDGPAVSNAPAWLQYFGGYYITPDSAQTIGIVDRFNFITISINSIAHPNNNGFSMPSNCVIQNDSGFDLVCSVFVGLTHNADSGTQDYVLGAGVNGNAIPASQQLRYDLTTTQKMMNYQFITRIPDAGQIRPIIKNESSTTNSKASYHYMNVRPIGTY